MNENQLLNCLNYIPAEIQAAQDYESLAARFIDLSSFEYIAGGSGNDLTLEKNREAFSKWALVPRVLRDVTQGHTRLKILDREYQHPIFLAPVAYQKLAHPNGELETARGAEAMNTCMVVSTLSTYRLEEIADSNNAEKWFQLYFQANRQSTLDLIRRAENSSYQAIVVTVDASVRSPSLGALRAQFKMPSHCVAVNIQSYTDELINDTQTGESRIFQGVMKHAPTWQDLQWLIAQTDLPIFLKGVLHPEDAHSAREIGCAGIIVSNHGGRSLDGASASINCIKSIRNIVGDDYPVLLDSGIRSGVDIFKAIALGADAVLIGRLQIYALGVAGALGVAHMLRSLREELELCMAQAGCATLADIRKSTIRNMD